ncbi:hypothetical protein FOE67_03195, partial [Streptomyces calidiresistens]|nr:hypothetical protein [Streptomyces calidiresistens]
MSMSLPVVAAILLALTLLATLTYVAMLRSQRRHLAGEVRESRAACRERDRALQEWIADLSDTERGNPSRTEDHGRVGRRFAELLADANRVVTRRMAAERAATEDIARQLLVDLARRLRGMSGEQQNRILEAMRRHDHPDVVADLMEFDHRGQQVLRQVANLLVLAGAWPGRTHENTPVVDVVRGAFSRIEGYLRVRVVRSEDQRAVTGRVVEPLVMVLAELLDNATRYSHPDTEVRVAVEITQHGIAIVVEDAGIGLTATDRGRIARLMREPIGVTELGTPPKLGLATCALLAHRYGFRVSVDAESVFGGVRAVVLVPGPLLVAPSSPHEAGASTSDRAGPDAKP